MRRRSAAVTRLTARASVQRTSTVQACGSGHPGATAARCSPSHECSHRARRMRRKITPGSHPVQASLSVYMQRARCSLRQTHGAPCQTQAAVAKVRPGHLRPCEASMQAHAIHHPNYCRLQLHECAALPSTTKQRAAGSSALVERSSVATTPPLRAESLAGLTGRVMERLMHPRGAAP
jgi:hypothetical protein